MPDVIGFAKFLVWVWFGGLVLLAALLGLLAYLIAKGEM